MKFAKLSFAVVFGTYCYIYAVVIALAGGAVLVASHHRSVAKLKKICRTRTTRTGVNINYKYEHATLKTCSEAL